MKQIVPRLALAVLFAVCAAQPALSDQLFYTGGTVTVTSLPVTSGYTTQLGLYDDSLNRLLALMFDEPPGVSMVFDPSLYGISVGDELIFGIRMISGSPSDIEYFLGPASRNPDGIEHAHVTDMGGGVYDVGFEDLYGGGDLDFDDNVFRFAGGVRPTPAPEPATLALMGVGLAALGFARRRENR